MGILALYVFGSGLDRRPKKPDPSDRLLWPNPSSPGVVALTRNLAWIQAFGYPSSEYSDTLF